MLKVSFALSVLGWLVLSIVHLFCRVCWDNSLLWILVVSFLGSSMLGLGETLESGARIVSLVAGLLGVASARL